MDNFMDKLVDRINSQGAVRAQSMGDVRKRSGAEDDMAAEERIAKKIANSLSENVAAAVAESNKEYLAKIEEFKKENLDARLSATEELMAAQASAREGLIESVAGNIGDLKAELSDHMHKESVKCYKNTQVAVEETGTRTAETVLAGINGNNGTVKKLVIASLVLSAINFGCLVLIILWMFRII